MSEPPTALTQKIFSFFRAFVMAFGQPLRAARQRRTIDGKETIVARVAHFDCFSGISGDMTLAALLDAGVDAEAVRQGLDSLGLPIRLEVEKITKGGFAATQIRVAAPEEDEHRHLADVEAIL